MDPLGESLLRRLFESGERVTAGRRSRVAALTSSALVGYSQSRSVRERDACEGTLEAAMAAGAIRIEREKGPASDRPVIRVELADLERLASFLCLDTNASKIGVARAGLSQHLDSFPVLGDVLERWESLRKVRASGPDQFSDWVDAITVVQHMQRSEEALIDELPVREVSARIFKHSKRIEGLVGQLDVILSGSVESEPRAPADVLRELGLGREEQPVRMAGAVAIRRSRLTSILDEPYSAFSASSVHGIECIPTSVLTIENQTTFHTEAKRRCNDDVLLIYTAGMPSPSWREMYRRLLQGLPTTVPVKHWGDVDEGGFRIAANIAAVAASAGHTLLPHRMSPIDVPVDMQVAATEVKSDRMAKFAALAGWHEIAKLVAEARITVEQEALD